MLRKRGNYNASMKLLKQPKVYNDKLEMAIKNRLNYFETLQKKLDAHQTKASSIELRKQWLEKQKLNNYINEYDRIRGMITQNDRKGVSVEHLKNRTKNIRRFRC